LLYTINTNVLRGWFLGVNGTPSLQWTPTLRQ